MNPRGWQAEAYEEISKILKKPNPQNKVDGVTCALVNAGVGAGKTFFASYFAHQYLAGGANKEQNEQPRFTKVLIVSPNSSVKKGWSEEMEKFKRYVDYNYSTHTLHFSNARITNSMTRDNIIGITITYHFLEKNQEDLRREVDSNTLIIADEIHHCGDNKSWGEALRIVGENAGFVLSLSGTPYREDDNKIPFVRYDNNQGDGFALDCDFSYTYRESVEDKICCPTVFTSYELSATKTSIDGEETKLRSDDARMNRKLIRIERGQNISESNLYNLWEQGHHRLQEVRETKDSTYAGLVVCDDRQSAELLYEELKNSYGSDFCDIVISSFSEENKNEKQESNRSIKRINEFKQPGNIKQWLISVKQVSEGVNIPRLRVVVYASSVKTRLFVTQVMGRGVRNYKELSVNLDDTCSFFYYKNDKLDEIVKTIEQETAHIVAAREKEFKKADEQNKKASRSLIEELSVISDFSVKEDSDYYRSEEFDYTDKMQVEQFQRETGNEVDASIFYDFMKFQRANGSAPNQSKPVHPVARMEQKRDLNEKLKNQVLSRLSKINIKNGGSYKLGQDKIKELNKFLNDRVGVKNIALMNEDQLDKRIQVLKDLLNGTMDQIKYLANGRS